MIFGIAVIIVGYILSLQIISSLFSLKKDRVFLRYLMFYHTLLSIVYYLYALFNPSDSKQYFRKIIENYRGENWSDYYGVSTTFIEWIGFPFIKYLNFNYEASMALFSFLGFLGFVFFYRLVKERTVVKVKLYSIDLFTLFFFLPNLHFWSASFGKGAIIFLGIALFFYGLNKFQTGWFFLVLGAFITYHVRPHILFVIVVSTVLGMVFSGKGIGWFARMTVLAVSLVALAFIYQDVLELVGLEDAEGITDVFTLDQRSRIEDLSKATSGVDISSYPLPLQLFTFLFRPLFFDAPGVLGLIVSIENMFLLFITLYFLLRGGFKYILTGDFLTKTAFFSFITVSIALAQISGNLGLAIRQKSQVMFLFLFLILRFLDKVRTEELRLKWLKLNRIRKFKESRNS